MSQRQPRRGDMSKEAPITYGDVFHVTGNLAAQLITRGDAALMQSAETRALGQTQKGGVASVMQAAARANERAGVVVDGVDDATLAAAQGMAVTETFVPGKVVTVEYIAGHAVSTVVQPAPIDHVTAASTDLTIGEALEAAAMRAGDKPVERSDVAAIQSAERRATGFPETLPGNLASAAQSAAELNRRLPSDEKTTLADVISSATVDLPADKVVTVEDSQKIKESEARQS
ncbi:hypothetical protein KI387_015389, partial [Taxus chinensis]